jgi:cobaltochelatase CobN
MLRICTVDARGEQFRLVQLRGNLFVCTRQNGSCCCGWVEKGRMPFEPETLWASEWERRKIRNRVHLTFTGCLGPCAVGNNALIQLDGRSIWLKDLNDARLAPLVFDYIEALLTDSEARPPAALEDHIHQRYLSDEDEGSPVADDAFDRLDPVCLMDVDPSTARHTAEFGQRRYVFCAPSCRKLFLADPGAYIGG